MATQTFDPPKTAELCGNCGRHLTRVGPNGECLRCLANFGCGEDNEPLRTHPPTGQQSTTPSRYAHFEIEIGADGFPVELGAGAMAVTYRARDTVLNSAVALKVIDRTIAENPSARARFLREARAAAQIHHPNVARVTHYGEQDGECFYAMEMVEGETLEARVRREGPMPLALALEVVQQAARALAAAEAIGVVHRDIKPSNVMIASEAGGSMLVKVIDYGVAKLTNRAAEPASDQTQSRFVGTPAFASPEQFAEPTPGSIGTPSDIYSLGVTFWYLLTGRTPFVGQTLEEVRARQAQPLPLEQLKNVRVPPQVLALLRSMLALDPADRPQSARELLAAVNRCLVRFAPAALLRRKRSVVDLAAVAVAALVTALAVIYQQRARSTSEMDRAIAILPFQHLGPAGEDEFLSIGIQDEILTKLASLADLKVIARTSTEKYKSDAPDLKAVGQELGVGRVLSGSVQRVANTLRVNVQLIDTRTNAQLWASTYDRQLHDVFAVETEIASSVAQQLSAKLAGKISTQAPTGNSDAYNAYLRGAGIEHGKSGDASYAEAANAYREAVRLDPDFARAWARLSLVRSFLYSSGIDRNTNSAIAVKEAADRAMALAPEDGETWLAQGTYRYRVLSEFEPALQAYREAEKRLHNNSLVNEYMVYVLCRLGKWREAEAHFWRATELDPRNFRLWTMTAAQIFLPMGRFAEAQRAVDRALEISPNDEQALATQAQIFADQSRFDEAAAILARVPRDSTSMYVLNLRISLGMLRRNCDEAIFWSEQAERTAKPGQPPGLQVLGPLLTKAQCHEFAGRHAEARAAFERVAQALAPIPGTTTAPGRQTRGTLARAYAGLGEREKAIELALVGAAEAQHDAVLRPLAELQLIEIYARFGDADAVMELLPRVVEVPRGANNYSVLRHSPAFDRVRDDPRFQALLKNPPPVRY